MYYYSPGTKGFYSSDVHGAHVPADAREVHAETYFQLLDDQSAGKIIQANSTGNPVSVDAEPSAEGTIKMQIGAIENTVTPRRLREAALGVDGGWLKDVEDQIAALRAKLTS